MAMTAVPSGSIRCGDALVDRTTLLARAARVAAGLDRLGVAAGDRVALLMRNAVEFVEISLGVGRLGAYAVPINWHLREAEVTALLDDCAPAAIFAHAELAGALPPQWVDRVPQFRVGTGEPRDTGEPSAPASRTDHAAWRDASAAHAGPVRVAPGSIIYTSGTTGHPKGVERAPATDAEQAELRRVRAMLYRIDARSRVAVPGPMYHAFPNQIAMLAATSAEHLEIMPRFDAEALLALIERERITSVGLAPIMFVRLLRLPREIRERYDLSSLEWALHAGGPCPADVKRGMIAWWGPVVAEYYGGTETGPLTLCDSREWLAHPGTCGKPLPGVELRIVDAARRDVAPGASGEIFGRLACYPDFTYRGDAAKREEVGLDELVSLGDIGYRDADGYLFLCDRARDMIISGGVNVYPAEVEAALFGLDGVEDCAVVGIPDPEFGEAVIAFAAGNALDGERLRAELRTRIAGYKVPREIVIVDTLERDASGKVRKPGWRDRYLAMRAGGSAART